jgi:hypothetical protein
MACKQEILFNKVTLHHLTAQTIEHRIFSPENCDSILLLTRNQLNLLQAKMSQRERFAVNPRTIPTINFIVTTNPR